MNMQGKNVFTLNILFGFYSSTRKVYRQIKHYHLRSESIDSIIEKFDFKPFFCMLF